MFDVKAARREFLDKSLGFYIEDPSRRSVSTNKCYYRSPDGKKCVIGMHIPDNKYTPELENLRATEVRVWTRLPAFVTALGAGFLSRVQELHDAESFWTSTGLSEFGLQRLSEIKRDFL